MTEITNIMKNEENKFLETVIQDPDVKDIRGGIPDLVDGYSFTRTQTLSIQLDKSASGPATDNFDIWIVDWDNESTAPLLAQYYLRDPNSVGAGKGDAFYSVIPAAAWQLDIGGTMAYVMTKGTSPFPSSDPSTVGPTQPLAQISLKFDGSVLSGNSRVVGKSIEVKYTAPEISAQGLWTQGTYTTYEQDSNINFVGPPADASPGIIYNSVRTTIKGCPPGTVKDIVKYPNTIQRPAYDGVLQAANMNYFANVPHLPAPFDKVYKADVVPTGATQFWDLILRQDYAAGYAAANTIYNFTPANPLQPYWKTNSEIHFAVVTGLTNLATLQLWRTLTLESYPDPTDPLITFAKPAPLVNMHALEIAMNGVRSSQQFWAAGDNMFGTFAKGLKGAFKKFKTVGSMGLNVAASTNPAAAAALNQVNSMKAEAKRMKRIALGQNANTSQNHAYAALHEETLQMAKSKRKRTKPVNNGKQASSPNGKAVKK